MSTKPILRRITGALARFAAAERGTVTFETIIILPILVWSWLAMVTYWDVYRAMNQIQKAAYTISDNLSRTAGTVDGPYIDGLLKLMNFLVSGDHPAQLRVTVIKYTTATNTYSVDWSYSPSSKLAELTNADLVALKPSLPIMYDLERVFLVETRVPYTPPISLETVDPINIGLGTQTFSEFIITKPRYIAKVCFTGRVCPLT